jgi:hypothetical protein
MSKAAQEAIREITNPIRHNNLRTRRAALGLSRVALGRILDVDPATVYRREQERPMAALWDYALRGIEAEAKSRESKQVRRSFKEGLGHQTFIPDQLDARGYSYTAEKMHETLRQHAQKKARPDKPDKGNVDHSAPGERRPREPWRRGPSKDEIKRIADRAERSK